MAGAFNQCSCGALIQMAVISSPLRGVLLPRYASAPCALDDPGACASALQIPTSIKRLSWDLRVGALEVLDGDALSVPELRVGVVRQNFARDLNFDDYTLGMDEHSWAIQTASQSLYKVHAGKGPSPPQGESALW